MTSHILYKFKLPNAQYCTAIFYSDENHMLANCSPGVHCLTDISGLIYRTWVTSPDQSCLGTSAWGLVFMHLPFRRPCPIDIHDTTVDARQQAFHILVTPKQRNHRCGMRFIWESSWSGVCGGIPGFSGGLRQGSSRFLLQDMLFMNSFIHYQGEFHLKACFSS